MGGYILITAAHNEEAFMEQTCESVVAQTIRPVKWIVVNDASSDRTSGIVARFREQNPDLIELFDIERAPGRDFRNKVLAFNTGLTRARQLSFDYIGNLDADISLPPDYYASVLSRFEQDGRLGIGGGMVASSINGRFISQDVALDTVAGAVQLFRRDCFDEVGGYLPLRHGGVDSAAEIIARKIGWRVRTFPDLKVLEHRRTGSAAGSMFPRVREGMRLYSLGYGLIFFIARCVRRSMEQPRVVGSLMALYGYLLSKFRGDPLVLPADIVAYLRREQRAKMLRLLKPHRFASRD